VALVLEMAAQETPRVMAVLAVLVVGVMAVESKAM
tara:strand:+ start:329 stop:433 length:105 start_codon:yes stop_codon:yes gene_type:complete